MAKFSATIVVVTVAVLACYMSQEVIAQQQPMDGSLGLGERCSNRDQCNASLCSSPNLICCDKYSAALAHDKVVTSVKGYCTCCQKGCDASLGKAGNQTPGLQTSADSYHQNCQQ